MTARAEIEDTYAEAFRSIYAEVLITARDRRWLDHAVSSATGNASSTILCDCEAGLDHYLEDAETPDGRPGAIVQFHVPRFRKDRVESLERSLLVRLSQNVLTCATASCFCPDPGENRFKLGRKIASSATATRDVPSATAGASGSSRHSAANSSSTADSAGTRG